MPTRSASISLSRVKLICCCADDTLGGRDAALHRLAAADGAEQDRREDRGRGGHGLLALGADLAGDVVLRDVRDFVRHDARQLRLGGGRQHQALVQEHEAAGHGEGVDRGVLDDEELEVPPAVGALRGEPLPDRLQVLADLRVLDERVLVAQLARHHGAQAVLIGVRDDRRRRDCPCRAGPSRHVGVPSTIGLDAGGSAAKATPVAVRKRGDREEYEEGAHGYSLTALDGLKFPYVYRRLQARPQPSDTQGYT